KSFIINGSSKVKMVFEADELDQVADQGNISYLVISDDDFDYETTTHWGLIWAVDINQVLKFLVDLILNKKEAPVNNRVNNSRDKISIVEGKEENRNGIFSKKVTVSSPEHLENVKVNVSIPEVRYKFQVDLVSLSEQTGVSVDDFQLKDTNGNGLYDTVEWMVPSLSEKTFEVKVDFNKVDFVSRVADSIDNYNGTRTANLYSGFVNYYDNEKQQYQPINTIITKSDEEGFAYQNIKNNFKSYFDDKNVNVRFAIDRSSWIDYYLVDQEFGKVNKNFSIFTNGSRITYVNVFDNIDVRYTVTMDGLLEEFILNKPKTISRIEEQIKISGVFYEKMNDGSIKFYSKDGEVLCNIPKPVMWEETNISNRCYGLHYEIEERNNAYFIIKIIDKEGLDWLLDDNRSYPVVIDTTTDLQPSVQDVSLYYNPGFNPRDYRAFLKFDISSIPDGANIEAVYLKLYCYSDDSRVGGWDGDAIFWNVGSQTWTESTSVGTLWGYSTYDQTEGSMGTGTGWKTSTDISTIFNRDYNAENTYCSIKYADPDHNSASPNGKTDSTTGLPVGFGSDGRGYARYRPREYSTSTYRPILEVVYTTNNAPTITSASITDRDDTDNCYAMKKYYTFTAEVNDADGASDIAEVRLRGKDGAATLFEVRAYNLDSTPAYSIVTGSSTIDLDTANCNWGEEGNAGTATFKIRFEWDHPQKNDCELAVYVEDTSSASAGWTDKQTNYFDIINRLVTKEFAAKDGRINIGGTASLIGDVRYATTTGGNTPSYSYPPNAQFTAVKIHNSAHSVVCSDTTISNGHFECSFKIPDAVQSNTYHVYLDMAGDYTDADAPDGDTVSVIGDQVKVTSIAVSNYAYYGGSRYWDANSPMTITYTAVLDYDETAFNGELNVGYSGAPTAWGTTSSLVATPNDYSAGNVVTRNDVTAGSVSNGGTYGITSLTVTASKPDVGWDGEAPTAPTNAQCRPDGCSDTGETDNDKTIYLTWTDASDGSGSGIAGHYAEIGNSAPTTLVDDDVSNCDYDNGGSEGVNTYYIRAKDNVGNWGSYDSDTITIDLNDAPTAVVHTSSCDSVHYGGKFYNFVTLHGDADGKTDIKYAYASFGSSYSDIAFYTQPNDAEPTVTVMFGSNYLIGTPGCIVAPLNDTHFAITWYYTIDWDWTHDDSAVIDYFANTQDQSDAL
ncbi:MAG: hypothetical protein DRN24_05880, partial [Thermoplasmata archaeon]